MQGDGGRKAGGELAQEPKEANQETPPWATSSPHPFFVKIICKNLTATRNYCVVGYIPTQSGSELLPAIGRWSNPTNAISDALTLTQHQRKVTTRSQDGDSVLDLDRTFDCLNVIKQLRRKFFGNGLWKLVERSVRRGSRRRVFAARLASCEPVSPRNRVVRSERACRALSISFVWLVSRQPL
jgi:hypothetical protein